MPLGTSYLTETVPYVASGVTQQLTPAQMNATFGAGNVKTATKSFSIVQNGQTINFIKNVPRYCDAGLLALLVLHNAPVV
ncbi:hypothetical protein [Glaciimonas sp. PCH181]|uniref:hypothetical protein n=1 Tax=Glaciimonas sp. PCH181 TaxID=2133943 RepID=UPI000D3836D6|nr:hypothetical protein [Glaciimonas sp. PCH181]PUA19587.1 hypothetical protein C7W93_07005 [Glaciimonas sp. PCH181]